MEENLAITQLYEQYLLKELTTNSNTELLTSFLELKTKIIQEMPNKESKDKISMLCDLLTDVNYEDTKRAFAEGFLTAEKLYKKDS